MVVVSPLELSAAQLRPPLRLSNSEIRRTKPPFHPVRRRVQGLSQNSLTDFDSGSRLQFSQPSSTVTRSHTDSQAVRVRRRPRARSALPPTRRAHSSRHRSRGAPRTSRAWRRHRDRRGRRPSETRCGGWRVRRRTMYASRWRGLSHSAIISASQPAKWRACADPASAASPRATSFSSANWRIVSNIENRVRPVDRSATSNDLRTSASSRSRTLNSSASSDSATAQAL